MANGTSDIDNLLGDFVAETREALEQIGRQLVQNERDGANAETIDLLFRFVHTVKGSCGFLDLPRIAALAHAAETALGAVRDGARTLDPATTDALLATVDRIALLVDAIETGASVDVQPGDETLIAAVERDAVAPIMPTLQPAAADRDLQPRGAERTIRVGVGRVDALMAQMSDLVLARNEVARALAHASGAGIDDALFARLSSAISDVRESVARVRMQPIERLFASLPRLARETAKQLGKDVQLVVEGSSVEVDREMVEAIRDPLVHVIRNAIDHGLESAEERAVAGKPAKGTIRIAADQAGNQVSIRVSDDGRGIDTDKLLKRAVAAKLIDGSEANRLDATSALELIFAPGLSTAAQITQVSGRGVGMDIVRENVRRLGGTVELDNRPGIGLAVTLRVPLTLSIMNVLLFELGTSVFALPAPAVEEIVRVDAAAVRLEAIGGTHVLLLRGRMMSVVTLADLLGIAAEPPRHLIIASTATGLRFAIGVDRIIDHAELVVRPIAPQLSALGLYAGQLLSELGRPVLLIDSSGIAREAGVEGSAHVPELERVAGDEARHSLLLFEGLDGAVRGIAARVVRRIEDVDRAAFIHTGGRDFVALGNELHPVLIQGNLPVTGLVSTLHLPDGDATTVYPIANVLDVVGVETLASLDSPDIAGVAMIDGKPVEVMAWPQRKPTPGNARKIAA